MAKKVGSFLTGLRGEHASLDEVLAGKVVDKQYRLIDLQRANVYYDKKHQQVTIQRPDIANNIQVPVRPAFHDYMKKHGASVRYMTRNGTPWLTEEEKRDPKKTEDYFHALKSGPKQDVAMVNWQKTGNNPIRQTGHAALSVGELDLQPDTDAKGNPIDPRRVEGYEQHAGGSFYPSPSVWRERKAMGESKRRDTGDHDPSSHASGVLVRNSLKPTAVAAGAAAAAGAVATVLSGKKRGPIRTTIKAVTAGAAAYAGGYIAGSLQSSPGSIKIKDEKAAHGAMAILISPSQHDILEHSLVGLSRTYHGKYNVLKSNCADFAEDMLGLVGIDTHELVQTAMESAPSCDVPERRTMGERIAKNQIRPDRFSWAMKHLKSGDEGLIKVDGQEVCLQKFQVSGQSALLIEAADGGLLKYPPLTMLDHVLADAVEVAAPKGPARAEFAFNGRVRAAEAEHQR